MSCGPADVDSLVACESWDEVLSVYESPRDSVRMIDLWNINRALALTGKLADDAFKYPQHGPEGLLPEWNRTPLEGAMLSDICYAAGHVALAQRFAFESDVLQPETHDPRMVKRLVQTNIIYGTWDVAAKYINFLEREGGVWKEWAKEQRRFLRNDVAVESDPGYGPLRRCVKGDNLISGAGGLYDDLKSVISINPGMRGAVDVLGTLLLLECDYDAFHAFVDEYFGTEALPSLPESFAEAACLLSEVDRGWWKRVGVSPDTYKEYTTFVKRFGNGLSVEKYRGTYWYYVMRLNVK